MDRSVPAPVVGECASIAAGNRNTAVRRAVAVLGVLFSAAQIVLDKASRIAERTRCGKCFINGNLVHKTSVRGGIMEIVESAGGWVSCIGTASMTSEVLGVSREVGGRGKGAAGVV